MTTSLLRRGGYSRFGVNPRRRSLSLPRPAKTIACAQRAPSLAAEIPFAGRFTHIRRQTFAFGLLGAGRKQGQRDAGLEKFQRAVEGDCLCRSR